MVKLAINGGDKVRTKPFPGYNQIDQREMDAVARVLRSGKLSSYLGCWHPHFYGGVEVQALESEWADYFGARHAIAVNSNTSGLICAVGAAGIVPGDEVIVSPYTMSASATSIMIFNGVPVFADVEPEYFCLDPAAVEAKITERTRAIMVVDILGQPHDANEIRKIARENGLIVIEDAAQVPGAKYHGEWAGRLGDMGIFSLNYHKHIHCGEGGVIVTDDDRLAERCRLIRNHAEAVVEDKGVGELCNMIGFNFRMTEVEAAIAREQLKKLEGVITPRVENCDYLYEKIADLPMLINPGVRPGATHVHYLQAFLYDETKANGVHRDRFLDAVRAELPLTELREGEGVLLGGGYVKPLYLLPLYQRGGPECSYNFPQYRGTANYSPGICPVVEELHERRLITNEHIHPSMTRHDLDDVAHAFRKVAENIHEIG